MQQARLIRPHFTDQLNRKHNASKSTNGKHNNALSRRTWGVTREIITSGSTKNQTGSREQLPK